MDCCCCCGPPQEMNNMYIYCRSLSALCYLRPLLCYSKAQEEKETLL